MDKASYDIQIKQWIDIVYFEPKNKLVTLTFRRNIMKVNKSTNFKILKPMAYLGSLIILIALGVGIWHSQRQRAQKTEELIALANEQKLQESREQEAEEEKLKNNAALFQNIQAAVTNDLPGIVCWGDSLTAGAGDKSPGGGGVSDDFIIVNSK